MPTQTNGLKDGEVISIRVKEYNRLIEARRKLDCLEGAGVDNWEGYDYAMEDFYGEDDDD